MNVKELACFRHVQWDPGRKELLKFAGSMLVGFAMLGTLAAWRRHGITPTVLTLWSIGGGLAIAALIPGLGKLAYLAVHTVSGVIGFVISRIILTVIFFVLFAPLGFLLRLSGKDLLHTRRSVTGSEWIVRAGSRERKSYYQQF